MPDQDPYAAIATPIAAARRAPIATADPYAAIAKPITDPYWAIARPINFDDLGGKMISPPGSASPRSSNGIDFSDLGGKRVSPPPNGQNAPITPATATEEPVSKGPLHQVGGFLQGAGENIAGTVKGVHDLFQGPQNDEENAVHSALAGIHGEAAARIGLPIYRLLHGANDTLNQMDEAGRLGAKEQKESGSMRAGLLTDMENEPFIGKATKLAEHGEYGQSLGDLLTTILTLRMGGKGAARLPEAISGETAEAAIPKPPIVAGTTLPETVGQAASRAKPTGIGADIKGLEDLSRKLPGSGRLRDVSTSQQSAAREVLANKANAATGAEVSTHPEAIEQNAANAAENARQAGSAKYEEIGKAADKADLTPTVEAAHSILTDDTLAKTLPKSARDALGKVASSMTERETISRQIYGKAYADLDAGQQAEVGEASAGVTPQTSSGFATVLKARSELADGANGMKDAADRFQMHKALDSFDQAVNDSLAAHDKISGSDLTGELGKAKQLWSQKYAFETFRDGLQDIMRDQPHSGHREINGAAFQKFVNDLDPRGAKGATPLQRMFPGDAQSVKDLHDLADYMGRHQAGAGSLAGGMAKLRILGLKESALGLIANNVGFAWLLSKPGVARDILAVYKFGKSAAQAGRSAAAVSAAAGELNHEANNLSSLASQANNTSAPTTDNPVTLRDSGASLPNHSDNSDDSFRINQVDYDSLAKQYGAVSSRPATAPAGSVDYDALAKQHGAISSAPANTFTAPKGAEKHKPVSENSQLRDARTKKVYAQAERDASGRLVWGPPQ